MNVGKILACLIFGVIKKTFNTVSFFLSMSSLPSIVLKVEVADLIQELESLSKCLHHLLAGLPLLDSGVVLAQYLPQVNTVVIEGAHELLLCHVLRLVHQEGHDCFGHHIVHALADRVEVRDDETLDNVRLQLRSR